MQRSSSLQVHDALQRDAVLKRGEKGLQSWALQIGFARLHNANKRGIMGTIAAKSHRMAFVYISSWEQGTKWYRTAVPYAMCCSLQAGSNATQLQTACDELA